MVAKKHLKKWLGQPLLEKIVDLVGEGGSKKTG